MALDAAPLDEAPVCLHRRGLPLQVVPLRYFRMFSTTEVNELLGGGTALALDPADMRRNTRYAGGYSGSSLTIHTFWRVVASMSDAERRALLKFVTGTGRAPLGGFQHLEPPLTIAKVDCGASVLARLGGPDVDRLPSASTCFNTLKLPNYRRASTMRAKLLYAIHSKAGFDLS
jgi:HECT-domain (ubiquitin-transferase)